MQALPGHPVDVVAGSNGCTVAVRLALAFPDQVERLVLAWPATAGDLAVDSRTRTELAAMGATAETIDALLAGQTLRGVTDGELATVAMPVGVLPALPTNLFHQQRTAEALGALLPHSVALPGCPETVRPDFPLHLRSFLEAVTAFLGS
jgi:pimeloyl-ACP methyl ester carboxylesterase